ncbi:SCO family protein [Cohnella faecalis]|uniref:SCO family protein n=1 Tax=Cohnella faecalis TaxID=2315694 RepID=A0A398CKS0_9BACL|nr:SCO family protein [Cohnella faecalis]RIE02752.1 SCO family protein [Cohnella faecalis]
MFPKKYGFPLAVLALCLILGGYLLWSQKKDSELPIEQQGAPFSYTDLDGQTVSLDNTNGKVRLLYFFFANCPDVCPPTTFMLSQVQNQLKEAGLFGDKAQLLSVTIDPARDTVDSLKKFGDQFNADYSGWKFLRGDEKATEELAKKYQIWVSKDSPESFSHMNLIVLLDKKGQVREWISAKDYIEMGADNLPVSNIVDKIKSLI